MREHFDLRSRTRRSKIPVVIAAVGTKTIARKPVDNPESLSKGISVEVSG